MMDAALKAKWVEALRSGKYEQARGQLRQRDGFCCLGVLCEIAGLKIADDDGNSVYGDDGALSGYRPISKLLGKHGYSELAERNDGGSNHRPHTFPEIADYIETTL